ncbi:MAG: HAD family hydrolase [Clostridia bacterium]|nr:HAD family hydrolase [Clostridia bacterium]
MTTNINKIKCAVFDLDGTLLNTIKTINHYLNLALSEHGLGSVSEADCMSFVGDGAVKLIERALARVGVDNSLFDRVYKTYNDAYNASPYYLTTVYEGITELLSALKSRGIKLAVLSNKPDFAVCKAVDKFLPDTFDIIHGGRDGIPLKPAPDSLFEILNDLGVTPIETAYIGDSEPDVLTAKNANIALPIFVSWGFRSVEQLTFAGAEILVDNPMEIINYI